MSGLPDRLVEFVGALREHGIPVGPGETVDAAAAVDVLGLADREQLRAALAATVLRRSGQRAAFDALFDLYFPVAVGSAETAAEASDLNELRNALVAALAEGDAERLRGLAAAGVEVFGQYGSFGEGGSGGGGMSGWSAYQTLERVRPDALLNRVLAAIRGEQGDGLGEALARQEAQSRIASFREQVQAEARRRTAEYRGRDRIARHAVAPQTDLVSFTNASRQQLTELRRTIQPLSRKLATRLASRRRRARRGQIDLRRTLRRSLATGGVPMRPAMRERRPGRPELVLLCDMSGSVAGFAQFTLLLVQALADQFSKVRTFAFVELTDEITELVTAGAADPEGLARRIMTEARLTRWGMSSDYGDSLGSFVEGWLDAVGPRTSVLILGDGRTNGGDPNLAAVRDIADHAKHVHWLNPEPRSAWGTGDSAALEYGRVVPMHECRNLRQLTQLVTELLPG
ncbi:VWA domain-containing protein [Amycolatopsis acidiphila]|uniref:VWA domain-containing protein n=1 Tax=Amycolatopsis acidiphila TaxID=715473 RepID=A0A558AK21_9PSEU|nr:VWA domain-containing protein [Amycolatopsis acidiphila]TVT24603.1 VWA domain-containing protein [Amycolatopsis acidiphila]UIJ58552.1 VWA domain-containing protein [Amycolatopsis acidiphila]GHG76892.1 VWA domain-containing protein [Amycolatopsis acidiphila]